MANLYYYRTPGYFQLNFLPLSVVKKNATFAVSWPQFRLPSFCCISGLLLPPNFSKPRGQSLTTQTRNLSPWKPNIHTVQRRNLLLISLWVSSTVQLVAVYFLRYMLHALSVLYLEYKPLLVVASILIFNSYTYICRREFPHLFSASLLFLITQLPGVRFPGIFL
jgi:hypothetical protein